MYFITAEFYWNMRNLSTQTYIGRGRPFVRSSSFLQSEWNMYESLRTHVACVSAIFLIIHSICTVAHNKHPVTMKYAAVFFALLAVVGESYVPRTCLTSLLFFAHLLLTCYEFAVIQSLPGLASPSLTFRRLLWERSLP